MAKKKNIHFYVVWKGKVPGVYSRWDECEKQVKGVEQAKFKGFETREQAEKAFAEGPELYIACKTPRTTNKPAGAAGAIGIAGGAAGTTAATRPIYPALAVDAACSGNPGVLEFRGVIADTGTEVFHRGPYKGGTNNIGEFLAIVLGLAYLKQNNLPWVLYSDSKTALAWLRKKQAGTKLQPNARNAELFDMLTKAEHWLALNTYTTQVHKWDTDQWGEIPADFGRK